MLLALLLSSAPLPAPQTAILDVRRAPWAYHERRIQLCGELDPETSVLYSGTTYDIHGRVGIRLRGKLQGSGYVCLVGRVERVDGLSKAAIDARGYIEVTDAGVPAFYVFELSTD